MIEEAQFNRSRDRDSSLYERARDDHPDVHDPQRYGWSSLPHMLARFDAILRLLQARPVWMHETPLEELTIFDFGCGAGHLINYLHQNGVGRRYYGIDGYAPNIEEFIPTSGAEAWNLYWDGESELPFDVHEVDVVVQTGAFSTMVPDVRATMFLKLLRLSHMAFLGTFIQPSLAATPSDGIIICQPNDILPLVDNTRYQYVLLGDYLPWDFALGVFRSPRYKIEIR